MRKILTLLLVVSLISNAFVVCAQKEASNWVFGVHGGLDFSCSTPQFYPTSFDGLEGGAAISSVNGELLFYTDGDAVWSRDNRIMPNGRGIGALCSGYGNYASSTQSALFVPHPGQPNLYYIFTADCAEDGFGVGLRYSVVDLSLNGGMGDVVEKNKPLVANTGEKIAAVFQPNGKDVWVVTHGVLSDNFYAFSITSTGLDATPVVSSVGQYHTGGKGYMKFSPDGKRLAVGCFVDGFGNDGIPLELFKFDSNTGKITTDFILPTGTQSVYAISFSPNGKMLYVTYAFWSSPYDVVEQFNLDAGTPQQIYNQRYTLDARTEGSIQLGIDGRLYFFSWGRTKVAQFLSVIMYPNEPGPACTTIYEYVEVPCWMGALAGLPNFIESYFATPVPTTACSSQSMSFVEHFDFSVSINCNTGNVEIDNKSLVQQADFARGSMNYTWYIDFGDGSTYSSSQPEDVIHTYTVPGTYAITLTVRMNDCVIHSMEQFVTIEGQVPAFSYKQECETLDVNFSNLTPTLGNTYTWTWNFGDNSVDNISNAMNPTHQYSSPGKYTVALTATRNCEVGTTQFIIEVKKPLAVSLGPDMDFCFGTQHTFSTVSQADAVYKWNTGEVGPFVTVATPGRYSLTASRDGCLAADTVQLTYQACHLCSTVVKDVYIGNDTTICETDTVYLSVDESVAGDFLWSNGEIDHGINVTKPGLYWLTLTQGNCQTIDTVMIKIRDCINCDVFIPNVFTPDIDSKNDVFAIDIKCEHYAFSLTLYNRWGDKLITVYEPTWNGRIRNEFVPAGIYYYAVQYSFTGPQSRVITNQKKGWLHVIR